jgi:hypothetical protein
MFNAPTTAITNAQKNANANIKPLTLSLMMPSFVWFSNKKQLYPSIPYYSTSLAYIINNCQALYSTARKKIHQWRDKLRMVFPHRRETSHWQPEQKNIPFGHIASKG